jgi:hypothetical protein
LHSCPPTIVFVTVKFINLNLVLFAFFNQITFIIVHLVIININYSFFVGTYLVKISDENAPSFEFDCKQSDKKVNETMRAREA